MLWLFLLPCRSVATAGFRSTTTMPNDFLTHNIPGSAIYLYGNRWSTYRTYDGHVMGGFIGVQSRARLFSVALD